MKELRINYNPFNNDYTSGYNEHSIQLYNKGKQKKFDEYIRGIIKGNVLYLRVFYPFDDIDTLTSDKLYQSSYTLLKEYETNILKVINENENININEVKYNVTNDLLKDLNFINI